VISLSVLSSLILGKFPRLLLFYTRPEMLLLFFQPRLSPQEWTNIPTWVSMTYFNVCAWIMFIHMQTCYLSDVIM
jgi:hypothetical protein